MYIIVYTYFHIATWYDMSLPYSLQNRTTRASMFRGRRRRWSNILTVINELRNKETCKRQTHNTKEQYEYTSLHLQVNGPTTNSSYINKHTMRVRRTPVPQHCLPFHLPIKGFRLIALATAACFRPCPHILSYVNNADQIVRLRVHLWSTIPPGPLAWYSSQSCEF